MSKHHLKLSVRGVLNRNNRDLQKALKGCLTVNGKVLQAAQEIRDFLYDQLSEGKEYLPCGECEDFDYKKGCPGHEDPTENEKEE